MKNGKATTIAEAATAAFRLAGRPLSLQELYETIVSQGLYRFRARNPESVLDIEMKRRCNNIDFSKSAKERPFTQLKGNKFGFVAMQLSGAYGAKFSKSDLEDLKAIEAIREGNVNAFAVLERKHGPYILQKALKSVGGDVDRAKDITQDIMIKAFEKLGTYQVKYSFSTWLSKIAANHIIDSARGRMKREDLHKTLSVHAYDDMEPVELQVASADPNPERAAMMKQSVSALERCLERVSPQERAALELFYYEEKSYKEISAELGMQVNNLRILLHRAKAKIKDMMSPSLQVQH